MAGNRSMILLAGACGWGNVGDDAIGLAICRSLREVAPDASIIVRGGNPSRICRTTGESSRYFGWRSPLRAGRGEHAITLRELQPADLAERVVAALADRERVAAEIQSSVKAMSADARECAAAAIKLANGGACGDRGTSSQEREGTQLVA